MDLKSKIILISGATASGKTNLAITLAKKINGEITMQIVCKFIKNLNFSLQDLLLKSKKI